MAAVLAWFLPEPQPDAVFGRLDYWQFWNAVILSLGAASLLLVASARQEKRRRRLMKLAAIWIGIVIAVLAIEVVVCFLPIPHPMDNPWYLTSQRAARSDVELPYERPAHFKWTGLSKGELTRPIGDPDPFAKTVVFQTDMEGFRNSVDQTQADIVVVGDSFTEAGNINEEETYSWLIGKKLGVATRNMGRAGVSTACERDVLKKYGLKCHPKVVIWQIAESNDLDDAINYERWVSLGRPSFFKLFVDRPHSYRESWQRRSPTFRLFCLLRHNDSPKWPFSGMFRDSNGQDCEVRFRLEPSLVQPAQGHPGWAPFSSALTEGAAICRTNGIQLVVVLIPVKYRVLAPYTRFSEEVMSHTTNFVGLADSVSMDSVLRPLCASLAVPFVDTTPTLAQKAAAGRMVFVPFDTHLSPEGHEVVATLIADKLVQLGAATNATNSVPDSATHSR